MTEKVNEKKYTISELAKSLEMSKSTIRYYEEIDLICPARTEGNQRIYSDKDYQRLILIMRGKKFGATLDEIAEMIGHSDAEMNEISQIEKSFKYIKIKYDEIEIKRKELELFEDDLRSVEKNLIERVKKLKKEKL